MEARPIKLSPKKGGHGHVTSYSINLGSAEVKLCGFVDPDGNTVQLEKIVDPISKTITIRIASPSE